MEGAREPPTRRRRRRVPHRLTDWTRWPRQKFFGRYLGIVPIAMLVAAILSAAIGSGGCFEDEAILDAEAAIGSGLLVGACTCDEGRDWFSFALLIFEVNLIVVVDYFGERSAQDAVKALKEMSAPTCRARRDGEWLEVPVRELVPGDVVELAAGIIIPSDGTLVGKGEPMLIDESSLTGESLAVTKYPGDEVLSGAVVMQGELDMEVSRTGPATFFGKTIALLSNVKTQGNVQKLLGTVAKIMCLVGLLGCIPIFFVLLFRDGQEWAGALKLAIVVLVAVLPVAMPLVVTTALAVGALELSREQAIVQRLSAIEEMAGMNILCSDKTGTLTKNELELDFEEVWCRAGTTVRDVLLVACLAAKIHGGQDAIDKAVTRALDALPEADGGGLAQLEAWRVDKFIPFNPVDKRTEATCVDAEGRGHVYSKGAPNVMVALAADSPQVRAAAEDRILANAERGLRSLGVARLVDVPGDAGASAGKMWQLLGLIALLDPPRDDTAATILEAQEKGVEVKMITGDARAIAVETCARLHMGTNIIGAEIWSSEGDALLRAKGSLGEVVEEVNGFASVFPEHKYRIVESLQDRGHLVGMTGDGVNDAPALKRANVGIAVAGATDAAKAAADIVLTAPGLSTIITAINQSRKIFARLQVRGEWNRDPSPTHWVPLCRASPPRMPSSCRADSLPTLTQPTPGLHHVPHGLERADFGLLLPVHHRAGLQLPDLGPHPAVARQRLHGNGDVQGLSAGGPGPAAVEHGEGHGDFGAHRHLRLPRQLPAALPRPPAVRQLVARPRRAPAPLRVRGGRGDVPQPGVDDPAQHLRHAEQVLLLHHEEGECMRPHAGRLGALAVLASKCLANAFRVMSSARWEWPRTDLNPRRGAGPACRR